MRFLLLLITAVIVAGIVNTTGAVYDSRNYANHRAHVFINGDQIVSVTPVGNALAPDNTIGGIGIQLDANGEAVIKVTSPANPVLAASAQIHVEIETGVVEQQPTFVEANEWIAVLNAGKYQASLDLLGGFIGGGAQGGSGIVGTIAGGFLLVGDIGAIGINVGRQFGWAEGDYDSLETSMAVVGILLTGTPADAIPTFCRAIPVTLKTLPAHLAEKAVRLLRTTYKLLLKNFEAVPTLWSLIQRIYNDPDLVKAVFVASDGSFEALKAVSEIFAKAGDDFLTALRGLPLNTSDEIRHANSAVVCLNIILASPQLVTRVLNRGRITETLTNLTRVLATDASGANKYLFGGSVVKVMEKIETLRTPNATYHVLDYIKDAADIVFHCPGVKGLDDLSTVLSGQNSMTHLSSLLFELRAGATLAKQGKNIAKMGDNGTFRDIILADGSVYEVKKSVEAVLNSYSDLFKHKTHPKTITPQDWMDSIGGLRDSIELGKEGGKIPRAIIINNGQVGRLDQSFLNELQNQGLTVIEMAAPLF